jgi:hypothetical protein
MTVILLPALTIAQAQTGSWNLSRDALISISSNPTTLSSPASAVWSFLENSSGILNPPTRNSYVALGTYTELCPVMPFSPKTFNCWQKTGHDFPMIGISPTATVAFKNANSDYKLSQGVVFLHPHDDSQAIVAWRAPMSGRVNVAGKVFLLDGGCGDGISWIVRKSERSNPTSSLSDLTAWSALGSGGSASISIRNLAVRAGAELYFVIDKNGNNGCDASALDVVITTAP